ncbi:MAG: hypothetical protein IJW92_01585 [Clostridia bacterium]|nr:hypothetical protein [Clostridia bacterium]
MYIKHFDLEKADAGKRITFLFEGVATYTTIYVKGCLMKHNFCGYTSFEVDVSDVIKFGEENVISVYVDTTTQHEGWWYEGGGIYRHVWLTKTDPVSIDLWGVFANPHRGKDAFGTTIFLQVTFSKVPRAPKNFLHQFIRSVRQECFCFARLFPVKLVSEWTDRAIAPQWNIFASSVGQSSSPVPQTVDEKRSHQGKVLV